MDDIVIVPLEARHIAKIENWPASSAVDTLLKQAQPIDQESGGDVLGWVALSGDDPVAIVIVTTNQTYSGYLDFFVLPTQRRHGLGGHMVEYALAQPEVQSLHNLRAYVEFDNTAAQKILTRRGFSRIGYSIDDRIEYERH